MKSTYYLTMIDDWKFIIHKETSLLSVTQEHEGEISNLVAIFKATDNWKHWTKFDEFNEKIDSVIYINPSFQQGIYVDKINNFLNK